jgi:hypothetical protein
MTMLVDFLCRFGFGMALGLVLTPSALVPPGFFRVNLLVVMGLGTFAALLAHGAVPGALWILPAAAAVVAWIGTVLWLAHRIRAGVGACALASALLAGAVAMAATVVPGGAAEVGGAPLQTITRHLLSGAIVGLTVHAMLLGHWYLNAPGMRVDALRRMIDVALLAWLPQLLLAIVAAGGARLLSDSSAVAPAVHSATASSLWALRWLAGLVGLPVLLWMSRKTLDIPNTQSATGILYVACLAAIVGELAAQLLAAG